eukprot:SAG11_NODE_1126_length_5765_cov_9.701553_7_plen_80_part_00
MHLHVVRYDCGSDGDEHADDTIGCAVPASQHVCAQNPVLGSEPSVGLRTQCKVLWIDLDESREIGSAAGEPAPVVCDRD